MALAYHRARWPKVTPTHQQYGIVARQRTSIGFKPAVCGDSGAGGLVAPLPCTAYFRIGKLATLYIVWLFLATASVGARPSPFVLLSQPSLT